MQAELVRIAAATDVARIYVLGTSLAKGKGADLGGGHFQLLSRPRIAILANAPVASDTYGHLWHQLDNVLGVPFTILEAHQLGNYDLRRYNVIVLPPHQGGLGAILEANAEALGTWVEGGGTLVAIGNSAAALTSGASGLSQVTLRRDALEDLAPFSVAAEREWAAREISIDEAVVWGDPAPAGPGSAEGEDEGEPEEDSATDSVDPEEDAWLRTFSPYGVTLRGMVQKHEWVTAGCRDELPVYVNGSSVLLAKSPVRTPVRLAPEERLRLGGLVWPEARERLAESAWLTVERSGNGQVILFAAMPAFRGYQHATARLFANAVIYGPGAGASQPIGW